MNTFDRHLLREWLHILGLVLAVTCGLLVAQVCFNDLRDLRDAGAHGWELWRYVLVTIPSFLAFVLPFAVLVSVLFVLTRLHRANELTAMRAAGVGFLRLTTPIWIVGVLCCGLVWWLNSTVVPWSVEDSRAILEGLQFRQEARTLPADRVGAVYDVAFENLHGHRMWFMNRFSQATHRGYGVNVSQLDPERRETERVIAAEGWRDAARGGWVFLRGRILRFNADNGVQVASRPFAERFEKFEEDPKLMLLIGQRPIDLSFFELRRLMAYFAIDRNPQGVQYAVRYYMLIAETLRPLIAIALAIPFAVAGVRANPAVGVGKSIGLFFVYYLLANFAGSLATKQVIEPNMAAWMPDLVVIGAAGWLFARLR